MRNGEAFAPCEKLELLSQIALVAIFHYPYGMATEDKERIWDAIRDFVHEIESLPGWTEWRRGKMDHVLSCDDPWWLKEGKVEIATEFMFPADIEKKHAVVMGFLRLADSVGALKECEFYFRRYPFKNLPVQRYRHLVNVCEMYFNRFYEIRERIKAVLNAINAVIAPQKLDVGKFIKTFDSVFDQEIRARHGVHHRERFDDVALNRLFLAEIMENKSERLEKSSLAEYRRVASEWVKRVRSRGKLMDEFLEVVAKAIVENCDLGSKAKVEGQVRASPNG